VPREAPLQKMIELLDNAVILLLIIVLFPLRILLFGVPAALLVRLLIEGAAILARRDPASRTQGHPAASPCSAAKPIPPTLHGRTTRGGVGCGR
jgi:hypothetical protein